MKRRGLLKLVGGTAVALVAVPTSIRALETPDDTAMLQRMLDNGEPIIGGHYRITDTLFLRRAGGRIIRAIFDVDFGDRDIWYIDISANEACVTGNIFCDRRAPNGPMPEHHS